MLAEEELRKIFSAVLNKVYAVLNDRNAVLAAIYDEIHLLAMTRQRSETPITLVKSQEVWESKSGTGSHRG